MVQTYEEAEDISTIKSTKDLLDILQWKDASIQANNGYILNNQSCIHLLETIDKEIVTYSSKEEALEKVNYLINNQDELSAIAKAGQSRTLKEHTYEIRMKELFEIIKKHILE